MPSPFRPDGTDNVLSAFDRLVKDATKEHRKKFRPAAGAGRKRRRRPAAVPPELREEIIRSLPCAQIFTHFWMIDVVSRLMAPMPELRNTDDEAMVFCEVRFPIIGDEERIRRCWTESRVPTGRGWCSPVEVDGSRFPDGPAGAGSRRRSSCSIGQCIPTTNLGAAEIRAGALTLSANSRERAERGEKLLSSRLGDLVGPALTSSQDPFQAIKEHQAEPKQNDTRPTSAEEVQAVHSFLDEHYRQTLDQPLPVLGGKTLRQAVKTKKGRKEAVEWLKQLENVEHRSAAEQGHKAYDAGWIWQELGIEGLR